MRMSLWRGSVVRVLLVVGLGVTVAWVCTATPVHAAKLERLKIAVAPIGYDTNFTWLNPRSGNLDKRPALEFLVGIDRHTGAYIPELNQTTQHWHTGSTHKRVISVRLGHRVYESRVD